MDQEARRRVLVVDDEIDVLKALMRVIQAHAQVRVALGAEAALEHMIKIEREDDERYDVVVVDFNMVGQHGAWLLERVRDRYPECRRVLVSGSSRFDLDTYLSPGLVHAFLDKPVDVDELLALVTG